MTKLEHLKEIIWNYKNNMSSTILVKRPENDPSDAEYYIYDSAGMRVKKITQRYIKNGDDTFKFLDTEEKIYLDGYEIKRNRRITLQNNSSKISLERFSCHLMEDKKCIAIIHKWNIDDKNRETDDLNIIKTHYQLGNHLGSCSLELDDEEKIISYEEYYPYGDTSFIAGKSYSSLLAKEVSIKEYRYSGKERDDNTGLYYYGLRYYAPRLVLWMNCDPAGIIGGLNLFAFVIGNPINMTDPDGRDGTPTVNLDAIQSILPSTEDLQEGPDDRVPPDDGGGGGVEGSSAESPYVVDKPDTPDTPLPTPQFIPPAVSGPYTDSPPLFPSVPPVQTFGAPDDLAPAVYGWKALENMADLGPGAPLPDPLVGAASGIATTLGNDDPKQLYNSQEAAKPAAAVLEAMAAAGGGATPLSIESPYGSAWDEPLGPGGPPAEPAASGGSGGEEPPHEPTHDIKYHYTDAPESQFKKGLYSQSSVTDTPNLTAPEAVDKLGLKRPPNKIIPILDKNHFVPNKPHIVQPHPLGGGGGKDFTNPRKVPAEDILPAIPIKGAPVIKRP